MAKEIFHPTTEQIDLSAVLDALSDPIRRSIVLRLAEVGELNCSAFSALGGKTSLTYHYVRLREAGVTRTRVDGAYRRISLRSEDLEQRFPGVLASVIAAARREAPLPSALSASA